MSRGVPGYIYIYIYIYIGKMLSDTTLIMLERITYIATILLLVQYKFQNH